MKILRLRVVIDYKENVFRDIEIQDNLSFEALHFCILDAFGFDDRQLGSFYESDDYWEKGEEIPQVDMFGTPEKPTKVMDQVVLSDKLHTTGQKMLYVYDFLNMWCFYVELSKIAKAEKDAAYPRIVQEFGKAPKQSSRSGSDVLGMDVSDEFSDERYDELGEEEFDDFDSEDLYDQGENFDNIDNYDM